MTQEIDAIESDAGADIPGPDLNTKTPTYKENCCQVNVGHCCTLPNLHDYCMKPTKKTVAK
jgi:hypothetical protein